MLLYRIVKEAYAGALFASGRAGRWNEEAQWVIYASGSRALASLELLVHAGSLRPLTGFKMLVVSVKLPENKTERILVSDLPENWRSVQAYPALQEIGSRWYRQQESLVLKVPSVLVPRESNYIIHAKHPDFATKVAIIRKEAYFWDERL
ncbi:MAG: RES family NAD+ phosphorylase [Bacteroidota bacterium]|nr:RES family NAD+ phosphorylase [Bacteroidota bacterium]